MNQVSTHFSSITARLLDISTAFRNYQATIKAFNLEYPVSAVPVFDKVLAKLGELHHELAEVSRSEGLIF